MSSSDHPNVLLITADHWPAALLGSAGHPAIMTPTLDQMARNGVRFSNALSACPICVPARRTLMTGLSPRGHSLRRNANKAMPEVPTLAESFRANGYQTGAVGKLHVHPQRNPIGFENVLLNEEGRGLGAGIGPDDWEMSLAKGGFAGQEYAGGGNNNDYFVTPWHLPDDCHQTSWTAREMCRMIHDRDTSRPGFWYLSFAAPHPPLWPLNSYLDMYRNRAIPEAAIGEWVDNLRPDAPAPLRQRLEGLATTDAPAATIDLAIRAFYAMATHIDHQIRVVLGTLFEEGILGNTSVVFTSDHGDMLGQHRMWGKCVMYEPSINVPLIIAPPANRKFKSCGTVDDRIVELRDIFPTVLDLAGLPTPAHLEGYSAFSETRRTQLYGEYGEAAGATRMLREERFKLIYYPEGNHFQLFDLVEDPQECRDLSGNPLQKEILSRLQAALIREFYDDDESWLQNGQLAGLPAKPGGPSTSLNYGGQRGYRFRE